MWRMKATINPVRRIHSADVVGEEGDEELTKGLGVDVDVRHAVDVGGGTSSRFPTMWARTKTMMPSPGERHDPFLAHGRPIEADAARGPFSRSWWTPGSPLCQPGPRGELFRRARRDPPLGVDGALRPGLNVKRVITRL